MRTVSGSRGRGRKTVRHRHRGGKEAEVAGDAGGHQGGRGIRIIPAGPDIAPFGDASQRRRMEAYRGHRSLIVADSRGPLLPPGRSRAISGPSARSG